MSTEQNTTIEFIADIVKTFSNDQGKSAASCSVFDTTKGRFLHIQCDSKAGEGLKPGQRVRLQAWIEKRGLCPKLIASQVEVLEESTPESAAKAEQRCRTFVRNRTAKLLASPAVASRQ